MAEREVIRFFIGFIVVAGVLAVLRAFSAGDITGGSVQEGEGALMLSDVRALREGALVVVSFLAASPSPQLEAVYALDAEGSELRSGSLSFIVEPRRAQYQSFRVALPDGTSDDLVLTLSVSDGISLAYERVRVSAKPAPLGRASRVRSSAVFTLTLVLVLGFIAVYLAQRLRHQRHMRALAARAQEHVHRRAHPSVT